MKPQGLSLGQGCPSPSGSAALQQPESQPGAAPLVLSSITQPPRALEAPLPLCTEQEGGLWTAGTRGGLAAGTDYSVQLRAL